MTADEARAKLEVDLVEGLIKKGAAPAQAQIIAEKVAASLSEGIEEMLQDGAFDS